jgi:hypothetical protein
MADSAQWQYGTYRPVPNPWSWVNLTNMVWVEQPVGTGFSQGNVTATSETDVADQFLGFFKNFVDLFGMQGYKVYITGKQHGIFCRARANKDRRVLCGLLRPIHRERHARNQRHNLL